MVVSRGHVALRNHNSLRSGKVVGQDGGWGGRTDRGGGVGKGLVGGHRRLNGQATYPGAKGAEMMERKHQNQEFEVLVRTRIMFITPFVKK